MSKPLVPRLVFVTRKALWSEIMERYGFTLVYCRNCNYVKVAGIKQSNCCSRPNYYFLTGLYAPPAIDPRKAKVCMLELI